MKKDSNMFKDNSIETEGVPADKTAEIPKVVDSTEEENAKKPLMLFGREFSRKQVCAAGAGILCAALLIGGGGYAITHADWTGKANAPAVSQPKDDEEHGGCRAGRGCGTQPLLSARHAHRYPCAREEGQGFGGLTDGKERRLHGKAF